MLKIDAGRTRSRSGSYPDHAGRDTQARHQPFVLMKEEGGSRRQYQHPKSEIAEVSGGPTTRSRNLHDRCKAAEAEIATWPEWMRKAAHFEGT